MLSSENFPKYLPMFKFRPLLKQTIWGGNRIIPFKGLSTSEENIGESWEISGVKGKETEVDGGIFNGMKVSELIDALKGRLVGENVYKKFGNKFPLLIKFIDAAKDLSIQVHPDDRMAHKYGFANGKTEMWYVVDAKKSAHIICGFDKKTTPSEYKRAVTDNSILSLLRDHSVKAGDCFFIPAGRIHSIGGGTLLIEIQQTSDITYRIYDYNRRDSEGKLRELHTALAAEAIDYNALAEYRAPYAPAAEKRVELVSCNSFTTSLFRLSKPFTADYSSVDCFIIYIVYDGGGEIEDENGCKLSLHKGETVLIPAETNRIRITPREKGMKFIETHT